MSKCMTIDETLDQKEISINISTKEIVEFILEEAIVAAVVTSDKDCSRIGDFNVTEDFCQQFDQFSTFSKDFDANKLNSSQNSSATIPELQLDSGESIDRSISLLTARENLEYILDSLIKREERVKNYNECKIISEEILADNELRIENGQIHIEKNVVDDDGKNSVRLEMLEYYNKEDVIKNEKIEIEYLNEGKINKIYVPLHKDSGNKSGIFNENEYKTKESIEKMFTPCADEDLRQVWENANSLIAKGWVMPEPSKEVVREELSSVQVFSEVSADPNRPRACAFAEEDVNKMTREIEQINFNQSLLNLDEFATAYRSDGKGDAYLESKSWNAENSIKDSKNKGASDSTIANYEQKSHFVGSKENVEQLALNLNDNSEFPSSRNLLRENTKSIECHLKHFSNPENSNAKLSEKNNETANESNIFSKDTNSIYGSREENFKDLPIGNYDVEKHASFERTESLIDSFQATSYAIPFECPSFYSHLDLNMNPGKIKMSQNFNNVDYKSENFKELHKSDEVLGNYGTIPSEQINGSLLNDSTYQNNEIGRLDMLHNLTLVQEFADDKIELKSTLDSIFNTKNSDYQSRSHVFGSHYENAERNGNLSSSGSNDVIENEPDNDFCKLSITSSEKSGGNTKRSQTGVRQIENTLSDSKLNTEKKFCIIKASQSVNNASKNFLSEQSTSSLARIKAESIDDGSFSLAKEVEASSSPESNSFFGNGKGTVKGFENDAQFILPQVSLFSNKSEDEMTEIEKLNHINFDSSSASSFLRKTAKESDEKSDLKNQENFKSSSSLEKLINYSSFTALTRNGQKEQQEFIERNQSEITLQPLDQEELNIIDNQILYDKELSETHSSDNFLPNSNNRSNNSIQDQSFSDSEQIKFKLHSPKMYSRINFDAAGCGGNDITLTNSKEAFIDLMENVIQIIDPADNSNDEEPCNISFSLPNELESAKTLDGQICYNTHRAVGSVKGTRLIKTVESVDSVEFPETAQATKAMSYEFHTSNSDIDTCSLADDGIRKNIFSGMTTIGPIKNPNYDPKDLISSDIDYGRMTHITTSKHLGKDLYVPEIGSASYLKFADDSDEGEIIENERMDVRSLVNRDIASLTKVQKIREVMSYHPKPEEDFEDDSNLSRPRLDLKDVESMSDERYKVPEVSIPMLSFEVGDNNSEVDKELVQSMHLVLSGNCFNGNDYFTDNNIEEIGQEIERSNSFTAIMSVNSDNDQEFLKIQRSDETLKEVADEKNVSNKCSDQPVCLRDSRDKVESSNSDTQYDTASSHQKYGTLGSVFRKASSKFIRRDVDIFLRNSKSLPRDTSKLVATESIKSILDDCHSSAANVLQKSRSLLKNTQTIFKTLSQSRFSTHGSINNLDKQKFSPSESDVSESEKKLTFLRKEDFTKAKIIIKSKLEKTFKTESKSFPEKKDFVPGEKEEEERCRKVLPKSPLVYKSQFVKSQINVQNNSFENVALKSSLKEMNKQSEIAGTASHTLFIPITNDQRSEKSLEASSEEQKSEQKLNLRNEEMHLNHEYEAEEEVPNFIVMETVQGLPISDLESPCHSAEVKNSKLLQQMQFFKDKGNQELYNRTKIDLVNSVQKLNDGVVYESSLRPSDRDETSKKLAILGKKGAEKKVRSKGKKFTARFRSFWCSAFGKVKTSPNNKREHS